MVEGSFTATQFYAEVDGHPDDRNVQLALEETGLFLFASRCAGRVQSAPLSQDWRARRRLMRQHALCISKRMPS